MARASNTHLIGLSILIGFTTILHADDIPLMIPYSGSVSVNGQSFDGSGQFKFAIINKSCTIEAEADQCASLWSNDGTSAAGSEPEAAVSIPVANGSFSVKLGNTNLSGMTTVPSSVFEAEETYLRIWFNDDIAGFQHLSNDRQLVSVPYAYRALNARRAQTADNVETIVVNKTHIVDNAIDSTKVEDGSLGISDVNTNEIQARLQASDEINITNNVVTVKESSITENHLSFDVATQVELDSTINVSANVPIGGIIDWWRPNNDVPIPSGYMIADGSQILDARSPYNNEFTPDLVGRFTQGVSEVDFNAANSNITGGSSSHDHQVDINHDHGNATGSAASAGGHKHSTDLDHDHAAHATANAGGHTHDVDLPNFTGSSTSADSGDHNHTVIQFGDTTICPPPPSPCFLRSVGWKDGAGTVINGYGTLIIIDRPGLHFARGTDYNDWMFLGRNYESNSESTSYMSSSNGTHSHSVPLDHDHASATSTSAGNHSHSVDLPPLGMLNRDSSSNGEHIHDVSVTVPALSVANRTATSSEHLPPYVGLLKLMRIF